MKAVAGTDLLNVRDGALLQTTGLTDMVLLYFTLLADKAVPGCYLPEFVNMETSMRRSSERSMKLAASLSDERLLWIDKKRKIQVSLSSSSAVDQLSGRSLYQAPSVPCLSGNRLAMRDRLPGIMLKQQSAVDGSLCWLTSFEITDLPLERLLRENPSCWEAAGEQSRYVAVSHPRHPEVRRVAHGRPTTFRFQSMCDSSSSIFKCACRSQVYVARLKMLHTSLFSMRFQASRTSSPTMHCTRIRGELLASARCIYTVRTQRL